MRLHRLFSTLFYLVALNLYQRFAEGFSLNDILKVLETAANTVKVLKDDHGAFMIDQTFYNDLIATCEELMIIDKDFDFFNQTGVCPNVTDSLMGIAAMIKVTSDPLLEIAATGISVADKIEKCANEEGASKYLCYFGGSPTVVKDLKYLINSFEQYSNVVKIMINGVKADMKYCTEVYDNLTQDQKQALENMSKSSGSNSCAQRAQEFIKKRIQASNLPSTSPPSQQSSTKKTVKKRRIISFPFTL